MATRLGRAVLVDGTALELAVTAGDAAGWDEPPTSEQLRMRLLRWSAALSVAETYQLEGFDAVVAEDALGDRLEDFLDLVEPEPVHVVVVPRRRRTRPRRDGACGSREPTSGPTSRASPQEVVAHLDESRVLTTPPA